MKKNFTWFSCSSGFIPLTFYLFIYQYNVRMKGQQEDRGSQESQHNRTVARRPLEVEQQQNNNRTTAMNNNEPTMNDSIV